MHIQRKLVVLQRKSLIRKNMSQDEKNAKELQEDLENTLMKQGRFYKKTVDRICRK
ncbi:hypothetical protein AGMMS50239_28920 [Bacteroidia bacterium]|nr:hypothetical protein AGMMS50239_28920 [Bacteroidia bacterium]